MSGVEMFAVSKFTAPWFL